MRSLAFELGGGEGDCDCGIGAAGLEQLAPPGSPDRLLPGQTLRPGQWLLSADGRWGLAMQRDGNLVLYRQDDGRSYWDLGSQGRGALFAMQTDGNLVMYDTAGAAIWNTGTAGRLGSLLVLQNDANLVLYERSTVYWQSDTMGAVRHEETSWFEDIVSTFVDVVNVVAPFAQTALSFVPGVGTVVNGAIAAGISLAKGESVTDALISGAINALPGGPAVKAAARAGVAIVQGENVGTAALNAARDALPGGPAIKAAYDLAVSLTVAQQVQQGNIAVVQLAAPPPPPPPAAPAGRLNVVRSKIEAGDTSFRQLAQNQLVDLTLTPQGVARKQAAKRKKIAIAVGSTSALGTAVYFGWPLLSRIMRNSFAS